MNQSIRRIGLLLLIGMIFSNVLVAQKLRGNYNFLSFEQKPYYLGLTLGYNTTTLKVKHSNDFILNDQYNLVQAAASPGMNLGFITNLKIGRYFDFRFLPTLSFTSRAIDYEENTASNSRTGQRLDALIVETPFHIRYKSKVYKDKRAFVITGIKYGLDVANISGARDAENLVKTSRSDFAFEFGVGLQFFLPYFIFSPELKFSHGLGNVLIYDGALNKSTILEKLVTRAFTISLHIEG